MSVTAGERRIVSVLVADVVGSTTIAEALGPERSKFLFDEIVTLMREEVERFGGTVAQLTGDGVLALFGVPTANENDPERAVRAALAVTDALVRYGDEIGPSYGISLAGRAAVNTGPVVVPSGDEPPDVLYNALGDTVNIAARLQALGNLVVGPETARHLQDRFELEPLGEVELKGKAEPVAASRVLGERETAAQPVLAPLVGREAELATLVETFDGLIAGTGAVVVITGEPGVGKSRLKSEARSRFKDGIRFLEGHAVSHGAETPYWSLREVLRDWLQLGFSDPEARVRLELRSNLARVLSNDAEDVYPFLASMLGLPLDAASDKRLRELSRDSVQQQTFDALYRLACAIAAEQPLCLVFDDIHWADEPTLAAIEALLPITDAQPVALALLYRAEGEHGGWDLADRARRRFRHRYVELDLEPLEPGAALQLAEEAAGADLPDSIASLLAERSGGNPFFLEEALRDLLDRGVLQKSNGSFEVVATGDVAVPTLVEETLQARLDRLEPATREVVSVASVVGRSFGAPLLEQIVPPERLRPALTDLQRLDLVVEERRQPAAEYRFRHGLVQEVAYRRLVGTLRRDLHRTVGEALERLHRDAPEEVYGLLARHYSEADEPERAVEYLLRAGDAARAAYAGEEAVDLYRRALAFMERAGDQARARQTLLKIALAHHWAFDFERASVAFEQAFALPASAERRLEPAEDIAMLTGARLRLPIPGDAYVDQEWELCRHMFRGLVQIARDNEVLPDVAASFSVSPDGGRYRFRLRPDMRWSDGEPVTADDFAFTWAQVPEEGGESAHLLDDVESASALDRLTLEVRLEEPRNYFLHLLAQPAYFPRPRHACLALGPEWREQRPLISNGPFVLTEFGDSGAKFEASRIWAGSRGNVRKIDLAFMAAPPEQQVETWRNGRYDAALLALGDLSVGEGAADSHAGMGTLYVAFRSDRGPLSDPLLRRALAHAIDRERLLNDHSRTPAGLIVAADPAGAGGVTAPTLPGHLHRVAPAYDPDSARRLLAEAGYPGGHGLRELTVADIEEVPPVADHVGRQLAEIGVRVRSVRVPFRVYGETVAVEPDAYFWAWGADYPDPGGIISSMLETQPALYRDEELLQALNRARSLRDPDKRLAAYRDAERRWIGDEVALVPIAYPRKFALVRPWIEGHWVNAVATSTFAEAVVRPELRSAPTRP